MTNAPITRGVDWYHDSDCCNPESFVTEVSLDPCSRGPQSGSDGHFMRGFLALRRVERDSITMSIAIVRCARSRPRRCDARMDA